MIGAVVCAILVLLAVLSVTTFVRRAARERLVVRAGAPGVTSAEVGPLRARRGPRIRALLPAAAGMLVAFVVGGPVLAGVVGVGVAGIARLRHRRRRRRDADVLESQLAGVVSGVAAALRAGLSLSQSIRFAERESSSPVRDELRTVTEREDLGVPLEEALGRWEKASPSEDVRLVANALRLRIGSGLPRVLDEVGRALRERRSVAREVRSLTVQARLSGTILGVLPVAFFAFLAITSRHDMAIAFATPLGIAAVVVGFLLQAGGYLWITRLVRVEAAP